MADDYALQSGQWSNDKVKRFQVHLNVLGDLVWALGKSGKKHNPTTRRILEVAQDMVPQIKAAYEAGNWGLVEQLLESASNDIQELDRKLKLQLEDEHGAINFDVMTDTELLVQEFDKSLYTVRNG